MVAFSGYFVSDEFCRFCLNNIFVEVESWWHSVVILSRMSLLMLDDNSLSLSTHDRQGAEICYLEL